MKNLINKEFKITSILVKAYFVDDLTASLIEQFKDKQVLLWQHKNFYHSCKRIQLCFGIDLISLLEDMVDEFDVLIVEKFRDKINPQETINFIKTISKMEKLKDKQFIFLFSTVSMNKGIQICDFVNLKDTILECSDNIYSFFSVDRSNVTGIIYQLQDIKNKEKYLLRTKINGSKTLLEKMDE